MSILVIDIGSSSVRALLYDATAQLIPDALVQYSHQFHVDQQGASSADAEELRRLVERCLDEILTHPAARTITAVGMATFAGNLLGLTADGQPITPVYTYADSRSAKAVEVLASQIDTFASQQRTGTPLHTAYHPARLYWLRETQPDLCQQVDQWVDLATWLYRCWFGTSVCSYSIASWSGLFNRQTLTWDAEWCAKLQLDPQSLPRLADYTAYQQGLQTPYAARWSVLRAVPFFLAVGDGAAANIGSGAGLPQQAALTIGTTAALRQTYQPAPTTVPSGLWSYHIGGGKTVLGGATSEGGNIFQWARQILVLPPAEQLEQELAQRHATAHGLHVLPLLFGERSPGWRLDAVGTIHGLRAATSAVDVLQALLESVALRLAQISTQLQQIQPFHILYAGGGALYTSPTWAQMVCNALNYPLHLIGEREVTARGVALLVLAAQNSQVEYAEPPVQSILTPQADAAAALEEARQQQIALYEQFYA